MFVLPVLVVGPVEGVVLRQGDDVGDVEPEGVSVLPLVLEIGEGGFGTAPVDDPLEIVPRKPEGKVLELGEDDDIFI